MEHTLPTFFDSQMFSTVPAGKMKFLPCNFNFVESIFMNKTIPGDPSFSDSWQGAQFFEEWNKELELKLSLEIRWLDDVAVVACKGRIVFRKEAAALSDAVAELLPQTRQLVLELSQVEAVDGAGLGELLAMLPRAQASGCAMKLVGLSKRVREVLELTRVASVFEIHPSVEEALLAVHA